MKAVFRSADNKIENAIILRSQDSQARWIQFKVATRQCYRRTLPSWCRKQQRWLTRKHSPTSLSAQRCAGADRRCAGRDAGAVLVCAVREMTVELGFDVLYAHHVVSVLIWVSSEAFIVEVTSVRCDYGHNSDNFDIFTGGAISYKGAVQ